MARTKGSLGKKTLEKMGQEIVKPLKKELTGKRGRPKKDKTFETIKTHVSVPDTTKVNTIKIVEVYKTDLTKVEKINQLAGRYCHMVSGNNYADAVRQAKEIMSELGYTIVNYFEQTTFGRSIIVSYNK